MNVLALLGSIVGLAMMLVAGPVHAQGDSRTIDVVPAETASSSASPEVHEAPHPANVGNSRAKGPEQRVALVIGNGAYANATPLTNPTRDAKQVAELLTAAGFEVTSGTDLDHDNMIQVIQDFAGKIAKRGPDTVAFVYYAGHGLQVAGDNFLVPIDAKISKEADVEPSTIRLVDIMATLEAVPSRMRIVVLDACRNDPFEALKDDSRGLAIVDAPNGSIVAYSTAPGTQAYDGTGNNSPYTSAFLRLARQPNVPIEQFFKKVRLLVNDATDGRQTPWESSSLTGDFYFFGNTTAASIKPAPVKAAYAPQALRSRPQRDAYEYVIAEDSVEYYEEFIDLYPHDPMLIRIRSLLAAKMMSIAWYNAVLANSPAAYQSFYSKFANSQYAQAALKLQLQPKAMPLYQPTKLIVPAQLAPQVKLTLLTVPQPKPLPNVKLDVVKQLDFSKAQNSNAGKQAELPNGQVQTPPPGKSLLDVRLHAKDNDRITAPNTNTRPGDNKIAVLPPADLKKREDFDARRPGGIEGRPGTVNPEGRIVVLPNNGRLNDQRFDDGVRRPLRPGRPEFQQGGSRPPRQVGPLDRILPNGRLANIQGAIQQGPRRQGQIQNQSRGPAARPIARRCGIVDGERVCR